MPWLGLESTIKIQPLTTNKWTIEWKGVYCVSTERISWNQRGAHNVLWSQQFYPFLDVGTKLL
jgi:hypothetical protein